MKEHQHTFEITQTLQSAPPSSLLPCFILTAAARTCCRCLCSEWVLLWNPQTVVFKAQMITRPIFWSQSVNRLKQFLRSNAKHLLLPASYIGLFSVFVLPTVDYLWVLDSWSNKTLLKRYGLCPGKACKAFWQRREMKRGGKQWIGTQTTNVALVSVWLLTLRLHFKEIMLKGTNNNS